MVNIYTNDGIVEFLNYNLINLYNIYGPLQTQSFQRPHKPWVADNIKLMMSLRKRTEQKFEQTQDDDHLGEYRQLGNNTTYVRRHKKYV